VKFIDPGSCVIRLREEEEKPKIGGLWRDNPATPEGKYLVTRRDGTTPDWPHFVIGARDPAAPAALRAYADAAVAAGLDPAYAEGVRRLAERFEEFRARRGQGDPDRHRHREDDPATVAKMREALARGGGSA
jgi:hypothetical protein